MALADEIAAMIHDAENDPRSVAQLDEMTAAWEASHVERSDEWWAGYHYGLWASQLPTLGAVRRLHGAVLREDPQYELMKAVAVELESVRRALARGARVDEIRGRALRLARVCEGEARAL